MLLKYNIWYKCKFYFNFRIAYIAFLYFGDQYVILQDGVWTLKHKILHSPHNEHILDMKLWKEFWWVMKPNY